MDEEDWEKIKEDIRYDYVKDNQFSELKRPRDTKRKTSTCS